MSKKVRKSQKKYLLSYFGGILTMLVSYLWVATPVFAQPQDWTGYCVAGPDNDVATLQGLECLIANIFTVFITVIGLAGFVMMVIASLKWLAGGSDSKHISSARSTITYSVVGLVVALSAFIIIRLLAAFTGIPWLTQFHIPTSDMVY